jgi:hypothetical protein
LRRRPGREGFGHGTRMIGAAGASCSGRRRPRRSGR